MKKFLKMSLSFYYKLKFAEKSSVNETDMGS